MLLFLSSIKATAKTVISVSPEGDHSTTPSSLFLITFMLCKITFVSASSWLLTNAGWESQDLFMIRKHSLFLDKNIISVVSFTKTAEMFCWIYRKISWMSWVFFSLFDKNFPTSFGILLSMEPIIIAEDEFQWSRFSDLILMSRYVSATRSTLRKLLDIELKNISINCSSVSGTLLIHDLIYAIISRTYALMCLSMISSFCILLLGIIHSTSFLFEVFLIEPSGWAKHIREQYAKGI